MKVVETPVRPGRVRRSPDLLRVLFGAAMTAVVVGLGRVGVHTTSGLEADVHNGSGLAPAFLLGGVTALTNIVTVIVPLGLAVERLARREATRVTDALIAALLCSGVTVGLNVWITSRFAPKWLPAELTRRLDSGSTTPLHLYIAVVVTFISVLGFRDRPSLRAFTWICIAVYATATLVSGNSALVGLVVSFLVARTIAFGYRYARGVPAERLTGLMVAQELRRAGVDPVYCRHLGEHDDVRTYEIRCADGRWLDVTVLERDRRGLGALYRTYHRLRLRGPAQRHNLFSVRRAVEHEALLSYALADSGIRTPRLVAVRALSVDAILVAYERTHTCPLRRIPREKFTDALMERVYCLVRDLGDHEIAHRRLSLDSILVDGKGKIWLRELRDGEVAVPGLSHVVDVAGAVTALALKVGPERAVRVGARVLGPDILVSSLSVLQPVVLARATRTALRRNRRLLPSVREHIVQLRPSAASAEPVNLERLKFRTVLSIAAGCFAVYALMLELSSVSSQSGHGLWQSVTAASPGWLLLAVASAALTYVAATAQLVGFVPEHLPKLQVLLVQVSASFVALFAPAAVGGATLNVRYLNRRGIPMGPAAGAVGASQAVAFVVHIALIAVFSFAAGSGYTHDKASTLMIAIILALAVLAMLALTVAPLRRLAHRHLGFFRGSLPRLLDVAQSPSRLIPALGGTVGLSLLNALCLYACVYALGDGGHPGYRAVTLIYLTVQAASSISPTPAGIGAIEIGLGTALAVTGVAKPYAVIAVLAYRLLTAYLPAAVGSVALHRLQRTNVV